MKNTAIYPAYHWRQAKHAESILNEIAQRIDEVLAGSTAGCFVVTTITRVPTEAEIEAAKADATPAQKAMRAESERIAAELVGKL
jgi:hypothetical protein